MIPQNIVPFIVPVDAYMVTDSSTLCWPICCQMFRKQGPNLEAQTTYNLSNWISRSYTDFPGLLYLKTMVNICSDLNLSLICNGDHQKLQLHLICLHLFHFTCLWFTHGLRIIQTLQISRPWLTRFYLTVWNLKVTFL